MKVRISISKSQYFLTFAYFIYGKDGSTYLADPWGLLGRVEQGEEINIRAAEAEFEEFDRRGLSPDERRREIARSYGAKK